MRTHTLLLLLSAFGVPCFGDVTDCEMSSKQIHYHLRNDLLCDYYAELRPKLEHRNTTKVFVRMVVQSFSYDVFKNTINVGSWMPMTWSDDHLKWDPSSYDNVNLIHLSSSEIWTPDLALYNKYNHDSVKKIFDTGVDCIIRHTGKVTCVPPSQHEAVCTADLRSYPYEKQKCMLRMGSWVHSGEEVDFRFSNRPVTIEDVPTGEWKILNVTVERYPGNYSCCPNNTYPSLGFTFAIERLPSYHEAVIIIPAVERKTLPNRHGHPPPFLIPTESSLRDPVNGHQYATYTTFARDSLLLCLVQFVTTVMLRRIIKVPVDNVGWISGAVGTLIQSRVGQAILVFDNSMKAVAIAKGDEDGANIIEKSQGTNNVDYIVFATLLDRLLCAIYVIIYATMFIRFVL